MSSPPINLYELHREITKDLGVYYSQTELLKELKRLKKEKELKKLKPSPEELSKRQLETDNKKLDEYVKKLNQQRDIATGLTKDITGEVSPKYSPEIQKLSQAQIPALEDSVKLWYEMQQLRNRGYDVSLPQLREYKTAEKQRKYIPLQQSVEQMRQRGFNEKTINLFSANYIKLIENGAEPETALRESYRITKIVNPTDFIMSKQQANR